MFSHAPAHVSSCCSPDPATALTVSLRPNRVALAGATPCTPSWVKPVVVSVTAAPTVSAPAEVPAAVYQTSDSVLDRATVTERVLMIAATNWPGTHGHAGYGPVTEVPVWATIVPAAAAVQRRQSLKVEGANPGPKLNADQA